MSLARDILTKCFQISKYEITNVIEERSRIVLEIERSGHSYCGKCGCVGGRYDSTRQEILIGA